MAAHAAGMRNPTPALLLLLAGCGGGSVSLEGTLADSAAVTEAWVAGGDARATVESGAFVLEEVPRDSAVIGFTREGADTSWMRLGAVASGGTLRMSAIRFSDGLAFPAAVEDPDTPVEVNGLRIGRADAIPGELNVPARVLAVSDDGDALIIRPSDEGLPDLSVVLTPGTVVQTVDGDPVDPDGLAFGDSLRVSGVGRGAYVIASEVTVPRRVATAGGDRSGSDEEDDDDGDRGSGSSSGGAGAPAAGGDDGDDRDGGGLLEQILGGGRDRGEEPEKGKGKGEERGKGKGRD